MAEQDETPTPNAESPEPEKEQLLLDIVAATEDIRTQISYVLSHYPEARDSDVRLAHLLCEMVYPEEARAFDFASFRTIADAPRFRRRRRCSS